MNYQPVIGLEIHIGLRTRSKMFCACLNDPNERRPNVNICPICLGHPGTLPVINKEAVKRVIKTGLALNCQIPEFSKFDRKNYFYPDLPKGYQISQYDMPLCKSGFLNIGDRKIRVNRIHLEEDTGRLAHPDGANYSLVDFNRAGIPLMELVTEPDIVSAKEAREFAKELQLILRYINVSTADMEKGEMRVEANISLMILGTKELGTKVEIKNLNSLRAVEKSIDYEIKRQEEVLDSGNKVIHETRGWSESKNATISQREKEEAHDYRYFSEPDLPILNITKEEIKEIKSEIPELPRQKRERFQKEYRLSEKEIDTFVSYRDLGDYFEKVISELRNWIKEVELKTKIFEKEFQKLIKLGANYILTDIQALLRRSSEPSQSQEISVAGENFLITPENFAEFLTLIYEEKISSKIAKIVLAEMFKVGADPSQIIKDKGLELITNTSEIEKIAKTIINKNQPAVQDYKKGKIGALQFLVGQIMKESRGRVNPQTAAELIKKLIS